MRFNVAQQILGTPIMTVLPVLLNVLADHQAVLERPVVGKPASLPVPNPTKSFWIDTPNANPLAKEGSKGPLTEDTDICIIGSGITGVSAAYHLSRLLSEQPPSSGPLNITILEARDFCKRFVHNLNIYHGQLTAPYRFGCYRRAFVSMDKPFSDISYSQAETVAISPPPCFMSSRDTLRSTVPTTQSELLLLKITRPPRSSKS